ncbi:dTDP-4-amino-4,6-dideoxygalactose transaminase [Halomonas fontilapidosi]|uniref:dTDP-4-amino-4,6-dideoxygalactose transaminase n=1 Tax=Halomonas fontilapidosi TaxID=616675 RepID=A0A7W5DGF2_9GAMM|nr:DegT/DnrJ/EryC1/StrS aminotransferase family protein [Halomonas fontilapidosi]MBB3182487.1 dTDP-4-amino-4,6-dideoxygalactose transaminase [Halomonas fontilapidosi]
MLDGPFSPWPCYSEEEAEAVRTVLLSNRVNYWTGQHGRLFEAEFADYVGVSHAISVANGTLALELALRGLGIGSCLGRRDEVIVPPRTFLASASSIVATGGVPVFADVDEDSQNITAANVAAAITPYTRAIIAVHLAGWPCEMDELLALSDRLGLYLIEDCAQAHGATWQGQSVGSLGHVGCWSFCQDKIMSTGGEGGMVTTRDEELWRRMWAYKDHGKSLAAVYEREHPPGFRWLHESFGSNFRLTEPQAVIGRLQLKRLPAWKQARRFNAEQIWSAASNCPGLRVPVVPPHIEHAAYKAYVFVEPNSLREGWSRDRIIAEIMSAGVPCLSGSCSEIYLEKAFQSIGWAPKRPLPVARRLGNTSLMFLCHPTLTDSEVELTCKVLKKVMRHAVK